MQFLEILISLFGFVFVNIDRNLNAHTKHYEMQLNDTVIMMCTNEFSKNLPPFLEKIKRTAVPEDHENYGFYCFLKDNDVTIDSKGSNICDFLKEKSIFITGGTGFVGKLLVEKLLRACIDIETIFLLVRPKKGKDEHSRLIDLLDDIIFEKLGSMHPNFKSKVQLINGDMLLPGLGINETNRQLLRSKVDIMFHVAATTRFDEHIKLAVQINVNATKEMIKLAKECPRLLSYVHVSTAYSNCNRRYIDEKFYKPIIGADEIRALTNTLSEKQLEDITPKLLKDLPNTYTLTKQIAENIVLTEGKNLPICVFRPSIIASTFREPVRSWIDNVFSFSGILLAAAVGLLKCLIGNTDVESHVVPGDYVINACIACCYETAKSRKSEDIVVYNYTSIKENPCTFGKMNSKELYVKYYRVGTTYAIRAPTRLLFIKSAFWYSIASFFYHTLYGYFLDTVLRIIGKKPRFVKAFKKVDKFIKALAFFTSTELDFEVRNTEKLWNSLNSQDQRAFPFDMKTFNWTSYLVTFFVGLKVYILKENLYNVYEGRRHFRRLYYSQLAISVIAFGLLLALFYKFVSF